MTQLVRMHLNACLLFQSIKNLFHTMYCQWSSFPKKHILTFNHIARTVLVNVLPERFTHIRVNTNFTLFLPFATNLDIAMVYIYQEEPAQLRYPNACVQD